MFGSYTAVLLFSLLATVHAIDTCTVFDPTEATIDSIHAKLYSKTATCRQVVQGYFAKIVALNGPINAIITLNPTALTTADAKDALLASNPALRQDLFCIPVLLKDNYDTFDMPTTGSSISLATSQPTIGSDPMNVSVFV